MKKQYLPVIVRRNGSQHCAKLFSSRANSLSDKFCWTLEEAKDVIQEVTAKLNVKTSSTMGIGGLGITFEHMESLDVIDSYIKVREITDWEVIK